MEIPTWDLFMAPILRVLSDGEVRRLRVLWEETATATGLTEAQREEVLSSGQAKAYNRVGWAASYLSRVGALERPARGQYAITKIGRQLLADHPDQISEADLRALARVDDRWWVARSRTPSPDPVMSASDTDAPVSTVLDPEEQIDEGTTRIHAAVAADLLSRLHDKEPAFFEQAVVKLLVAMGYGGANGEATVTSQSNDAGIDGIIDQDTLGLSRVYVQAKRYVSTASVQRPEIQAFVGALSGKADGGVFITTGKFSPGARVYADGVPTRVILIDGQRLTALMIRYGVGIQNKRTIHVVEVDEDFFE